jgi:hypothetical protein
MPKVDFAKLCQIEEHISSALKEKAQPLARWLSGKGFDDLEHLGTGAFATVVAPKNNKGGWPR